MTFDGPTPAQLVAVVAALLAVAVLVWVLRRTWRRVAIDRFQASVYECAARRRLW
jgi:hypothetical protein